MDVKRTSQRQAVPSQHETIASASAQQHGTMSHLEPRKGSKKLVIGISIVLIAAVVAYGLLSWLRIVGPMAGVKPDKYQAVFLANEQAQVYFGKITAITPDTIILRDVYYIKSQNQSNENKESQQSQAVLSKIDSESELHRPYNEMRINRDQVLFWENLQDESKIVKTIKSDTKQ